jgi:hypothetical protein
MKDRILRLLVPIVLLSPVALWILVGDMNTTYDYGIIRCVFGFPPACWCGTCTAQVGCAPERHLSCSALPSSSSLSGPPEEPRYR